MTVTGAAGSAPGGGGGGAGYTAGVVNAGGAGAQGQVRITWSQASPVVLPGNTNGAHLTYAFPSAGVASVALKAEAWGAGAGGFDSGSSNGGAGGGGGEYAAEPTLAVTPGVSYLIQIGIAGGSGVSGGGSTVAGDSVTVTAHGGSTATVATTGGVGGTGSANTNHHNGGAGGRDGTTGGGGGGGSAGTAAVGNAGAAGSTTSGGAGAAAVTGGGPGGAGGNAAVSGSTPSSAPGGGGGARGATGATNGIGRDGQIALTFSLIVPGVNILQQQFGTDLKLAVQIAWGANLANAEGTWAWTDITTDVQYNNKIKTIVGKADQASTSQPAQLSFTVDNTTAKYSQSALSPNWPNVQKNTPVRISLIYQGTAFTRFKGYVTGFTPTWDTSGKQALCNIVANGSLRRLGQGDASIFSFWKNQFLSDHLGPDLLGYWPCEDMAGATSVASAIGGSPGTLTDVHPSFASSSVFGGSAPLLQLGAGSIAFIPTSKISTPGNMGCLFLLQVPSGGLTANSPVMSFQTDSFYTLHLYYGTGGFYSVIANTTGATVATSSTFTVSATKQFLVAFSAKVISGAIHITGIDFYDATISTLSAAYLGSITDISVASSAFDHVTFIYAGLGDQASGTTVGHIALTDTDFNAYLFNLNADTQESPEARMARIAAGNGVLLQQDLGIDYPLYTMGPQDVATFVNTMREGETLDGGILYDGLDFGLHYTDATWIENQPATLTLDAALGQPADPIAPADDDLLIRNKWTVSRSGGSSAVVEDATTDAMGTATIGIYADSVTVNVSIDDALQYLAGWRVALGTVLGYRWPNVGLAIHNNPTLLLQWLACQPGSRITIKNLHTMRSQLQAVTVDLILQGYTETIDQFTYSVEGNTAPFDPWRIAQLAADTGDTSEFLCHLDSDGSSIVSTVSAGATSLSVATPSGPLWTTASDDFPFYISASGLQVKVTSITGSSSPQTFTVDGTTVLKSIPAASAVSIWGETVLGQGY